MKNKKQAELDLSIEKDKLEISENYKKSIDKNTSQRKRYVK